MDENFLQQFLKLHIIDIKKANILKQLENENSSLKKENLLLKNKHLNKSFVEKIEKISEKVEISLEKLRYCQLKKTTLYKKMSTISSRTLFHIQI